MCVQAGGRPAASQPAERQQPAGLPRQHNVRPSASKQAGRQGGGAPGCWRASRQGRRRTRPRRAPAPPATAQSLQTPLAPSRRCAPGSARTCSGRAGQGACRSGRHGAGGDSGGEGRARAWRGAAARHRASSPRRRPRTARSRKGCRPRAVASWRSVSGRRARSAARLASARASGVPTAGRRGMQGHRRRCAGRIFFVGACLGHTPCSQAPPKPQQPLQPLQRRPAHSPRMCGKRARQVASFMWGTLASSHSATGLISLSNEKG